MMDIIRRSIVLILFIVFFLFCIQNYFILSLGMNIISCKQTERTALLSFKQHLKDSYNSLSSWSGENCCSWSGVVCSNTTYHVVQLQLHHLGLGGELNPSLLELKQLNQLDLSLNDFDGISIPDFVGSFQSLRYLNLSRANFGGMVPHQLGNLSNLRYLDLSSNYSYRYELTVVGNFQWISHLSSLKHLDLSFVSLKNASDWFHAINMLPSLLILHLSHCKLSHVNNFTSLAVNNFTSLAVLDLSHNHLNSTLPEWLYSLTNLQQLDLSWNFFQGTISPSIGNLTNLQQLDLSRNSFQGTISPSIGNFQWISHLSSLKHLDLSDVNLENASDWFHAVNMLPSLIVLRLSRCDLSGALLPSSLSYVNNFTSLAVLDLSENNLDSTLPEWLYSLTNLQQLDLSSNSFHGTLSPSIGNLTKLTGLALSSNQLSGPLPDDQLGRLENLNYLSLRSNSFSGSIPFSIGRLTLLTYLNLGQNELNGSVPESIGNLSKLEDLFLFDNYGLEVSEVAFSTLTSLQRIGLQYVVLKVSPEWIPPFQLIFAVLRNCGLGPRFPNWIQTQKLLYQLDLSSNGISGSVPTWFWNLSNSQFNYLNLSHNHFNGELPKVFPSSSYTSYIYLSSNRFKGPLPRLASNVIELDLSNNSFSGSISTLVCNPLTTEVDTFLQVLDLSNNLLSGDLSQCWFYWTSLILLRLGSNNITGNIPSSMGSLLNLQSLHLENNTLSGGLPLSLRNCTSLKSIDIGENVLKGRLPLWLGESFLELIVLRLRRNKFYGEIPQQLCHLTSLQMLDLAHNNLSGSIPRCFNKFSAMVVTKRNSSRPISYSYSSIGREYVETTSLVTKGREFEYSNTLRLVTSMDLSKNSLSDEIPEELASLIGLRFLNLSENRFTGKIPEKIGNMSLLESLDLSNNSLSGVIPQSISRISSLGHLNLSYNNLSGKIPLGTQLQSFNESSFIGNQELCGLPLKNCNPPQKPDDHIGGRADEDEDWFEMKWFYMSMGVGFAVGFWAFWGVMVLKSSWRIAYFQFLDDTKDKLCLLF